uniref:AlNc14C39G3347 protein n=1 Tax=Albugo laibachii Nc14 TaxID=890382 RepID=F0W980_9STRA|nr:AlNc14C39G3347 [Albugo laibachii Nc14]CCA18339.1 AlNc14C49G3872 [Albugo laibachii Nc14]|eukprot:CCA18339.1 AlNc14C49G3872 [Albugo laibachii Nc14]
MDDNDGKGYFAPEVAFWAVNGAVTPTLKQKPFTVFYQTSWKKPTIKFLEDSKWVSTTMDRHDGLFSPFFKGIHQWYYYTQQAAGNFTYAFKNDTVTDDNEGRFYYAFGGGVWFHVSKLGPPEDTFSRIGSEVVVPTPKVMQ